MAKKPAECEEVADESWMATFADAITLLMAFFVMLLTFVEYDVPAFDDAAEAISDRVGGGGPPAPKKMLKMELEDAVYEMQADQAVSVNNDSKGLVIELSGGAFFYPGTATLREEAKPVLKRMGETLAAPEYSCFNIEIEGHTDDVPIRTVNFPSNWELSSGRSARVVRFFIEQKLQPFRFHSMGYAHTKPKVPNRDADGNPLRENQSTNRRIQMRVELMRLEEQERCLKAQESETTKQIASNTEAPEQATSNN